MRGFGKFTTIAKKKISPVIRIKNQKAALVPNSSELWGLLNNRTSWFPEGCQKPLNCFKIFELSKRTQWMRFQLWFFTRWPCWILALRFWGLAACQHVMSVGSEGGGWTAHCALDRLNFPTLKLNLRRWWMVLSSPLLKLRVKWWGGWWDSPLCPWPTQLSTVEGPKVRSAGKTSCHTNGVRPGAAQEWSRVMLN